MVAGGAIEVVICTPGFARAIVPPWRRTLPQTHDACRPTSIPCVTSTNAVPVLIDCDTGIDDSLALLYACASPDADIRAVTCVAGNVDAAQVGINTRAVLELAGRADIEVALGREVPLMRRLVTTPETHGPRGIGDAVLPPPSTALSRTPCARTSIIEEARSHPAS